MIKADDLKQHFGVDEGFMARRAIGLAMTDWSGIEMGGILEVYTHETKLHQLFQDGEEAPSVTQSKVSGRACSSLRPVPEAEAKIAKGLAATRRSKTLNSRCFFQTTSKHNHQGGEWGFL